MIMPSRFEPCGIVQIEAMRYGAIPIVRKVGGLADTVENFNSLTGEGTGFVFRDFDEYSLFGQIVRAEELHNIKPLWSKLVKNAMKADFSWQYSAKEYEKLYERALSFKNKKQQNQKMLEAIMG
jgi:starch synthase